MHRYIAFTWNHQIAERTSLVKTIVRRLRVTLPEWQCALNADGLLVYHICEEVSSSRAYRLDQNEGVLLGRIFHRRSDVNCNAHEVTFDKHETQKIKESEGRHLIEHYWGRYVALLREEGGTHVRILRDPTGAVPCLWSEISGINVVCSNIDDCATLELINCSINWNHIALYLRFPRLVTKDTGLDGVRWIHAGECVAIGASSTTTSFYWTPDRIHDARVIEDRQQAMRELRDVVQYCVGTWASCYNRILHKLSGGLDSAVVLACLSKVSDKSHIICENNFTQDTRGDERVFARKAASRAGVELIETPIRSSARTLDSMFELTKLATPAHTQLVPETELLRERLVKERNIEAVFSGQGGDHFFQQLKTSLVASDYAWRHGLRPEILGIIADTSRLTRKSIWSVMATVVNAGLLHRHGDPYIKRLIQPLLLTEDTRDSLNTNSIRHPWVDSATHLPGGKLHQIVNIIDSQNFYQQRSHYADIVHPLISQPIIELCLQIPSYILTYGGIGRALVRDAFVGDIPPEITNRTGKGGTTSAFNQLLVGNLPFLREFLLDGLLAKEGVLDRRKTEANLTESEIVRNPYLLFPVMHAIFTESWLRNWYGEDRRAAA